MALGSTFQQMRPFPLFPLPGAVLFPTMKMPLHIFEPRYRQMIRDAREQGQSIALGHIDESFGPDSGLSKVHPIAGVGTLEEVEELPDGRFLIVLLGRARIRIVSEQESAHPYRIAIAEVVEDEHADPKRSQPALDELRRVIVAIHQLEPRVASALSAVISTSSEIGEIADLIASRIDTDPALRQEWLEQLDPTLRLRAVTGTLETLLGSMVPHGSVKN